RGAPLAPGGRGRADVVARRPAGEALMAPRVVAVVQARLGSTPLPGEGRLPIARRPMLQLVLAPPRANPGVGHTRLRPTGNPQADGLVEIARSLGVPSVRGSVEDVLDRFRAALRAHPADAIVRLTADCPLLDPRVSGRVVAEYLAHRDDTDYVSNVEPPTYP